MGLKPFKILVVASLIAISSLAGARDSYLFGDSATDAFGPYQRSSSEHYFEERHGLVALGYAPLISDFGADQPTALWILIKDDAIRSPLTQAYVAALSTEKANLMALYHLSDRDYNRLAAIAFGILGRETKFGTSFKYLYKETNQDQVWELKLAKKKWNDSKLAIRARDPSKFFALKTWKTALNSRGLTQIKSIPASIAQSYCFNVDQLNNTRVTAITTLGFLAESLRILKNRVRNRHLSYVSDENLLDYVLYVYFGSLRQLVNPIVDLKTGRVVNDSATPDRNLYIQTVHRYMGALAMFENPSVPLRRPSVVSACR